MGDVRERFDLVDRHRRYDRRLYEKVMSQDPRLVLNYATPEAKRLYRMQRNVLCSLHLKKGFMRLERSKHGILYAKTRLEHRVADLLLSHFHNRFPTFHIAIEDGSMTYAISPSGRMTEHTLPVEEVVRRLESKLPVDPLLEGLEFDGRLWEGFYDSQYISERRNIKLMNKMMPLKHRDKNAMETRKAKGGHRITDYI
ncbi:MAG: DUF4130 domain-containing protein [Candidatus Altiarchaeales archaeon]|nr:DUF4130 domain-containing protein [Candidatus Altiarchaeales archaeon]MBD3416263.1 DUF4130 domain-containing protein [Candidatus Altiarchaeales archaeon]